MSWPNLYRPQKFADLHLTKVRDYFVGLLQKGRLPQVLLFAGPKGTGKTTSARILAAVLNSDYNEAQVKHAYLSKPDKTKAAEIKNQALKEPDLNQDSVLNILRGQSYAVQEMDAASNRGIDDVRALKEQAMIAPSSGLMSVFILDEAHMLTTQAFNALLKLLEEPPPHAVFILATTELDKLPDTIKSRCQIVQFYKASSEEVRKTINRVVKLEKIKITTEAVDTIITLAEGSFRDALKYLEICAQINEEITPETVHNLISPLFHQQASQLIRAVINKDETELIEIVAELRKKRVDEKRFLTNLITLLHNDLISLQANQSSSLSLTQAACRYLLNSMLLPELTYPSPVPLLRLELLCLDIIDKAKQKSSTSSNQNGSNPAKVAARPSNSSASTARNVISKSSSAQTIEVANQPLETQNIPQNLTETQVTEVIKPNNQPMATVLLEKWEEYLIALAKLNTSLAAFMRSAVPIMMDESLIQLQVFYKFHQQQLNLPKWRQMMADAALSINLTLPSIEVILTTPPPISPVVTDASPDQNQSLSQIASELLS